MKRSISLLLVILIVLSLAGCAKDSSIVSFINTNKIGNSKHKIELNCPELEKISRFEFDNMTEYEHYFIDENGIVYTINFVKPFFKTNTNAKILEDTNGFEFLLEMQADNNGWYDGFSYINFIKSEGLDIHKTMFLGHTAFIFDGKKLNFYDFVDTSERYNSEVEKSNNFKLLKKFDEDIISINGCIVKTKSKYYAIEEYIVNEEDTKKYADVVAKFDWRIVELKEEMFAIPIENIKFLYMPDLTSDSYFLIDNENNYYFNKTYIGG